jgi:hypothetical protein
MSNLVHVTFFRDHRATFKSEADLSLDDLRDLILRTSAPSKSQLPWLKLARFGESRSTNNCLRHNSNVAAITGVEMDYDAKSTSMESGIAPLEKAKILTLAFTSPSHRDDAPKWRVLCPTSMDLPPAMREVVAARINGACGGIFAKESFVLSQAYYYGSVRKNPQHRATIISGDPIDLRPDLDSAAIMKKERRQRESRTHKNVAVDPELMRLAMNVIPAADDWMTWNRIGMALWSSLEASDEGLEIFDEWSRRSTNYDADAVLERWDSYSRCPPTDLGVGTIIYEANGAWPPWRNKYDDDIEKSIAKSNRESTTTFEDLQRMKGE